MAKLQLSVAVCDYDRTLALFDGRVGVEGCELFMSALQPIESFHRAFRYQDFDVSELSLSGYASLLSKGSSPYLAIPVFPSRLFRHSGIYIRTDRGIQTPADLRGKVVGVPDYRITANVWLRGLFEDEYQVNPREIAWRQGGVEDVGRTDWQTFTLPRGVDYKPIPLNRTLSDMLADGKLDAVLSAIVPSCFLQGAPNVGRMFPDYRTREAEYFRKTGIFPIMHVIGIRRSLVERHPWLSVNVYKAFLEAKRLCMARLAQISHLYTSLPWAVDEFDATQRLLGADYWAYGVKENETVLQAFLRYHFDQGLSDRRMSPGELFAASTGESARA